MAKAQADISKMYKIKCYIKQKYSIKTKALFNQLTSNVSTDYRKYRQLTGIINITTSVRKNKIRILNKLTSHITIYYLKKKNHSTNKTTSITINITDNYTKQTTCQSTMQIIPQQVPQFHLQEYS